MRYALVILYFATVHYILSPASPPDSVEEVVPVPTRAEPRRAVEAPALAPPRIREAPARAISALPAESATDELMGVAPGGGQMTAVETAGEQRTSTFATPEVAERGESMKRLVQNELSRLACLTGKPNRSWGKKSSRKALWRFLNRAKARAADPDALLRLLRRYPENYCKLCRPGPTACTIEAMGAPQERSNVIPPVAEPVHSYLPPWMRGEKLAKAEEGLVRSDVRGTAVLPVREVRKPQRRRKPRSNLALKRRPWPALNGWPKGR